MYICNMYTHMYVHISICPDIKISEKSFIYMWQTVQTQRNPLTHICGSANTLTIKSRP